MLLITLPMAAPPHLSPITHHVNFYLPGDVKICLPTDVKNSLPTSVKICLPHHVKNCLPSHVKKCLTFAGDIDYRVRGQRNDI
jgi:hypothetical protein